MEDAIMTVTFEDGSEEECAIITVFPIEEEEGHLYIALLPLTEDVENKEGEIYLYRYTELGDGEIQIDNIEDDNEYKAVENVFDELLDNEEFDDLIDDY